jgi:hypothetical protein
VTMGANASPSWLGEGNRGTAGVGVEGNAAPASPSALADCHLPETSFGRI